MPVEIGPFSKMPGKLFGSGTAANLGPFSRLVFLALCEHANRNSSNTFKASDRALASDTGLAPRTIGDARKRLSEHNLISFSRQEGQSFNYTIPIHSFDWTPLDQRLRSNRKPRALHASREVLPSQTLLPPPWQILLNPKQTLLIRLGASIKD